MGATGLISIQKLEAKDYVVLAGIFDGFQPDAKTSITLLARDGQDVVGRIFLLAPTHIEGPWIRPDWRYGTLAKRLVASAETEARKCGITTLFAYGMDKEIEGYLQRLGFSQKPMTVWSKEL